MYLHEIGRARVEEWLDVNFDRILRRYLTAARSN
jgi:hypothetical protein